MNKMPLKSYRVNYLSKGNKSLSMQLRVFPITFHIASPPAQSVAIKYANTAAHNKSHPQHFIFICRSTRSSTMHQAYSGEESELSEEISAEWAGIIFIGGALLINGGGCPLGLHALEGRAWHFEHAASPDARNPDNGLFTKLERPLRAGAA